VLIPEQHFVDLEENVQYILGDIGGESISISELMFLVGNYLDDDGSILRAAADMDVPVFCPGIQDSMIGLQAWLYKQTNPFNVDAFADMKEFIEICNDAEDPCAMFVGGGVPMNYILQSMLVTPNEFDHVVHLSMDMHSSAPGFSCLDEARSWGKIGEDASYVTLYSDASITLPIIVAAVRTRLENGYI
jgi:deoxyhypusine synthase